MGAGWQRPLISEMMRLGRDEKEAEEINCSGPPPVTEGDKKPGRPASHLPLPPICYGVLCRDNRDLNRDSAALTPLPLQHTQDGPDPQRYLFL